MDITPTRDVYNPVLRRREVTFFTEHGRAVTPRLYDVRKELAARYGASEELVFVRRLMTLTGTTRAVGEAEVYDSVEDARSLVPKHIVARNLPERRKKSEEGAKKEETK
jgi:ribosomal protein S24E